MFVQVAHASAIPERCTKSQTVVLLALIAWRVDISKFSRREIYARRLNILVMNREQYRKTLSIAEKS